MKNATFLMVSPHSALLALLATGMFGAFNNALNSSPEHLKTAMLNAKSSTIGTKGR